jgi:hypothetical protein
MSVQVSTDSATAAPKDSIADMGLEVVILPGSDIDRAKRFYEQSEWRTNAPEGFRS